MTCLRRLGPASRLLCLALLCGGLSLPAHAARAAPRAAASPVTLNFPEAEIDAVSRAMAAILGRAIVVDPRVKGKLTLYTEQAVTPAQAYAIYLSGLRGLGFAVVETGGLLKVVPEAEAKLQTSSVALDTPPASTVGDQVITQVFRIVHENANNLVTVLRPLITPNNLINVNPGNNSLVITDYASNLSRLAAVISALDTPSATDVEVIPLQHTAASVLAVTVQRLLDPNGQPAGQGSASAAVASTPGGNAVVLADPSLNALLVRAPNPARLAMVRALVARLDQPGAGGARNVHVVYLKNAEATRLAVVLRAAFPAPSSSGGSALSSSNSAGVAPSTGALTAGASSGGSNSSSGASAQATAPVTSTAQPSTGGYIQADPASNALIITAPEPQMRELRAVIEQLDSRRAQLYVESLVAEVDANALSIERYDVIRARQRELPEDPKDVLPGHDMPQMPQMPEMPKASEAPVRTGPGPSS